MPNEFMKRYGSFSRAPKWKPKTEQQNKKIGIPKHIVEKLLDEIYFAVNPYLDTVSSKEDLEELKENFPWVAGLCSVYNGLLNNCPDEIKNEFDFIIENE